MLRLFQTDTTLCSRKAALRRKKQFEHALENTNGQIMTLEREIYSIETANINKETLEAMKNASNAMKQIHGGLTIDKVDQTMYVSGCGCDVLRTTLSSLILCLHREELREQHAIGEEIGEAITQSVGNQGLDETELDEELEALQQEKLDEEMLKAGPTPADRLPSAPEGVKAGKAPAQAEDEEEELRKLQAEMAM